MRTPPALLPLLRSRLQGDLLALLLLHAESDNLISRPLADLLMVTYGPLPILADALAGIAKVEEAYIYGSWAARYQGEPGPIPADVDVLVVGTASMDDLEDAAAKAQEQLRRPVNIRQVRPAAWRDPRPSDPFLASIRSRPLIDLRRRGEERRS